MKNEYDLIQDALYFEGLTKAEVEASEEIVQLLLEVIDPKSVVTWLTESKVVYGRTRPVDLLKSVQGRERLLADLNVLADGGPL